jgi:glutamate formiminotransferase / formiminotetrahydrofolate cyclodeaminase
LVQFKVTKDAEELKVGVAGSELVGLVPLGALLAAADFFMDKEGLMVLEEDQKVRLAVSRLGLSSISPFIPR